MLMKSLPVKCIGIIPARYGSSRFPGKALADIQGKSMVRRVYEQAVKAVGVVYVATDDERIFQNIVQSGGHAIMTSPLHNSGTDRCAEALKIAENQRKETFDVVLNIQGDEPFIEPRQLSLVMSCFRDPDTQIATLVKKIQEPDDLLDRNRPKVVVNRKSEAMYFSRLPVPFVRGMDSRDWLTMHDFYMHIGLYGFRKDILLRISKLKQSPLERCESLEQLRWLENGYRIKVRRTRYDSCGVDTPEDLERLLKMKQKS